MPRALALMLALALLPVAASALTLQDVVSLSKSGVSDEVIVAMIDRDKDVYRIEAAELMLLKNAGVSQTVVLALLRSGRQQPPEAAVIAAPIPPPPADLLIVGHGPDRPNTIHQYSGFVEPVPPDGTFSIPSVFFAAPLVASPCIPPVAVPPAPSAQGIFFAHPESNRGIFFRDAALPTSPAANAAVLSTADCRPQTHRPSRRRR